MLLVFGEVVIIFFELVADCGLDVGVGVFLLFFLVLDLALNEGLEFIFICIL